MMSEKGVCAGFLLPHPPVIIPEVGRGRENEAAATLSAYRQISEDALLLKPETVVVLSPHAPLFSDYIFMYDSPVLEGSFEQFGVPEPKFSYEQDGELRSEIENLMHNSGLPGGTLQESEMRRLNIENTLDHGVLVPLYYFGSEYKSFRLVAMSCSGLDMQKLYQLGGLIRQAAENIGRKICIIASGDMSHKENDESPYGSCPEGAIFDHLVADDLSAQNIPDLLKIDEALREKSAECGYRSLVILCGAFNGIKPQIQVYSSEAPFGIGYCTAKFLPTDEKTGNAFKAAFESVKADKENPYVTIARKTLESYVKERTIPKLSEFSDIINDEEFRRKAGVFVSIHKCGELRGCIGTTAPTTSSVAEEIIQNAVSAGTQDPRFNSVEENELVYLDYSVDVLSAAEPVNSKSELDPKRFGVIVRSGKRSGLLLPDLEGVDAIEQQLKIACRKAGIDPEDDYKILKFTVTRHNNTTAD